MPDREQSRVLKVVFVDENKQPVATGSHQLPEDPFDTRHYNRGLQEPPLSLEQLIHLAETHPIHQAALEQKTADVVGTGWEWRTTKEDAEEGQRDEINDWFESLFSDTEETPQEAVLALQDDVDTIAQGYWEIARDPQGVVQHVYPVSGHTIRFHRDGVRCAQVRGQRLAWFKRWNTAPGQDVDSRTGALKAGVEYGRKANELLVVKRRSRRSSLYGIPTYVSAIGWITLALAARDDNLLFFQNRREPRWAIILTNLEGDDDDLEESIRRAFAVDLAEPHRNIIIPITGPGNVNFQKMSSDRAEGSFPNLSEGANAMALVAHRVPPERLGMARIGPLGGNIALASSRIYKEAVVSPAQATLASRVNAFLAKEYPQRTETERDKPLDWLWTPNELDIAEDQENTNLVRDQYMGNLITLGEARTALGKEPLKDENDEDDPRNNKLYYEVTGAPAPEDEAKEQLSRIGTQLDELLGTGGAPAPQEEPADLRPPPETP